MIKLKYTESFKKRRFSNGVYITVALCLIIIGAAAWFALSSISDFDTTKEKNEDKEYNNNISSYIESTPIEEIAENTADTVSDQPYSSNETTVKEETKAVYILPVKGEIIKKHSENELQFSSTFGDLRIHTGIDIACETGTSISACSDGTVESITLDALLGNVVKIKHTNSITTVYAAVENLKVEIGSHVKAGDIIGAVGTAPSECADKNHFHFEVYKDGKICDPLKTLGLE